MCDVDADAASMRRYSRMLHPRHWWRTAGLTKRPRAAERRRLVAKPTAAVAEEDACSAVTSEPCSAVMLEDRKSVV